MNRENIEKALKMLLEEIVLQLANVPPDQRTIDSWKILLVHISRPGAVKLKPRSLSVSTGKTEGQNCFLPAKS